MNLSIDHKENIRSLQSKANYLGKKLMNHSQFGGKTYETCFVHKNLPPNRLHNVLCSYRHTPPEDIYRPTNINKQKKVPKIPHVILSPSKYSSYPVKKTFTKNYVIKNGELQRKYLEEKVANYTINCVCNNMSKLNEDNKNIQDLLKVKKEVKDDFSNFLIHYNKSLQLIGKLEKTNIYQEVKKKEQQNLCRNCYNKIFITPSLQNNNIYYEEDEVSLDDNNIRRYNNKSYIKRKMARFEDSYKPQKEVEMPKMKIEVPKLSNIGLDESIDEDVEDDEQEVEDYIWEDESISEMYRNSQKPVMSSNQRKETPKVEDTNEMNLPKHSYNREVNIYSKRTSAGISTIREIEEYIANGKEKYSNDEISVKYPTADRSFTEYIETPKQFFSSNDKNSIHSTSSNNTLVESEHTLKSFKAISGNLRKWDNIELISKRVVDNNSLPSSNKSSKKSSKSIKSFVSTDNNNHKNIYEKTKDDVINYDKELDISNYQLTETTKNKISLSSSSENNIQNSFSSKNEKKQDILLVKKNQRQDSISSLSSNNLNDNVSSKNDIFQRSTPSLSIITSQQLQQINRNIQLISSKNDISELDSLRLSLVNTFNGDELIDDNHIITSDKKNNFKSGNNLYEIKKIKNKNSLSSLSPLTSQNDTPSSFDKDGISPSGDKNKNMRKNNFSPSKNHQQPTHFSKMINEEPKTVNSTSSSSNISSLEEEEDRTIKDDIIIEEEMPIYQNLKDSQKSELISNLYGIVGKNKEVNDTDVIETLNDISKSNSTTDNNNLSNPKSLINAGNNIYLKEFNNKNENEELKENMNSPLNYKFNLIFNDKKIDENLNDELLLSDISSISDLENSIKNIKSNKNNTKSEKLIKLDNINEEVVNLSNQNKKSNEISLQKSSLLYDIDNILDGNDKEISLSSLSGMESSNSSSTTKKSSTKSSSKLSSKTSSSISTLLSNNLSNVSSSLSSLPSSATSLNEIK